MKNLTKIIFWIFISTMVMCGLMKISQPSQIKIEMDEPLNDIDSTIVIDTIQKDTIIITQTNILEDSTILTVCATMYHPVVGQCDDTPDITADQTKIPNIDSCSHLCWVAVSQDLLWFNDGPIRYGDTVYIEAGHKTGHYIVRDAMNRRFKKKIDFLESVGTDLYSFDKVKLVINS